MAQHEKYFTVREVAKQLKITEKLVRAEIGRKRLLANRIGGEYRISQTDLKTYIRLTYTGNQSEDEIISIGA